MVKVPRALEQDLAGRETAPLPAGALLRMQQISQMPGIAANFRMVIMEDGRCYVAQNDRSRPADRKAIYNVPMPDDPSAQLPVTAVEAVRSTLDEVGFFDEEPYVEDPDVRDGSLLIITARRGDTEHEVWYMRARNALTDLLFELAAAGGEESSWADLLEEQLALRRKLEDR